MRNSKHVSPTDLSHILQNANGTTVSILPLGGIIQGIVSDVKELSVSAKKFGEGDLKHRVALSGTDEMGQLASTFNTMASNIEKHQEVLIEKERLEADLALARDIQQRMLPQTAPVIPGLDVAGLSIPSREVGGDLFYFLPVANGRLGLTIGDVSGKSVPAALLWPSGDT